MSRKRLGTKVKIPIYGRDLNIIVIDDVHEGLKSIGIDDPNDADVEASVVEDPDGTIHLIISPDADINTICHEAFHITSGVLSDAGMGLCDKSEEGYAYLIGFIAEKIVKVIKTCKIKN